LIILSALVQTVELCCVMIHGYLVESILGWKEGFIFRRTVFFLNILVLFWDIRNSLEIDYWFTMCDVRRVQASRSSLMNL